VGRTHYSSEINESLENKQVTICGWVHRRRDLGGLIFLSIRDRTGLVQVVVNPDQEELFGKANNLRGEYVVEISGKVHLRPKDQINRKMKSGKVEIVAEEIELINKARTIPFQIDGLTDVSEEIRLKYRYLDLRREEMQRNLITRAKATAFIRNYLNDQGFLDIETPFLTKATPEGARDYLCPSRVHPGKFYALPQSPQIFKQLFMVAGFDKYYQIVRCFRDEDLRADRQPEFTQIDIETSFLNERDIQIIMEGLITGLFKHILDVDLKAPFEAKTYFEVLRDYGSDKPDLRIPLKFVEIEELVKNEDFAIFTDPANTKGSRVIAMNLEDGANKLTRKALDEYTKFVMRLGSKGLAYMKVNSLSNGKDGLQSSITKNMSEETLFNIVNKVGAKEGDLIFFGAGTEKQVNDSIGALRCKLGKDLDLYTHDWAPLWVIDFPMFEKNEDGSISPMHHPFTAPNVGNLSVLETDTPEEIISRGYDMVLNGYEIGGGSIRIHDEKMQAKVFKMLGISEEEAQEKFGFMLNALSYGTPKHGGLAFGLDRIIMLLLGTTNIKDVIAFPKTVKASCLMTEAPSNASLSQLKELSIATVKN